MSNNLKSFFLIFFLTLFTVNNSSIAADTVKTLNKKDIKLKEGLSRAEYKLKTSKGPVVVNVLKTDLKNENVSVITALPFTGKSKGKNYLTAITKKYKAYAGINANYFDISAGNSLGVLRSNGKWFTSPIYNRVGIGFAGDNIEIDQIKLYKNVSIYRGMFNKKLHSNKTIKCLNTPLHISMSSCLFDHSWGNKVYPGKGNKAYVVKNGCIKKTSGMSVKMPKEGYVIVSKKANSDFKMGDCLKTSDWHSNPDWSKFKEVISGGPYLIKSGMIFIDEKAEHINFAPKNLYAPRTAIGLDNKGLLYLVTVDGRQDEYSVGMKLTELATFLRGLGIVDAINLDGGGSTEMVINNEIVNKVSSGHERAISSALLILYNE